MPTGPRVLLTVDVEDWFMVENLKPRLPFSAWEGCEFRVERNVERLLDLIEEFGGERGRPARATFFVLGWVAERAPGLVRRIAARGHEIASHGFGHELCPALGLAELENDIVRSKRLLEDLTGRPVRGYRAPSFSVDERTLGILAESGFRYDASLNGFSGNPRYGKICLEPLERRGAACRLPNGLFEIPVSLMPFLGKRIPCGGGYFRLFPLALQRKPLSAALAETGSLCFYLHPWEMDPGQPRVRGLPPALGFRHYVNLGRTERKFSALLRHFSGAEFVTCGQYLDGAFGPESPHQRP